MNDEAREALVGMVKLFEMWRDGIFKQIGVEWINEPPAIIAARKVLGQ